jgi:hypothetical protein
MPNCAQAFVAALVQVTNTTANPVPNQDVDNPARNVFRLTAENYRFQEPRSLQGAWPSQRFSQWLPHDRILRRCLQHTAAASFHWWNFGRQPKPRCGNRLLTAKTLPDGTWDGTYHRYTFHSTAGAAFFSGKVPSLASVDYVVAQPLRI